MGFDADFGSCVAVDFGSLAGLLSVFGSWVVAGLGSVLGLISGFAVCEVFADLDSVRASAAGLVSCAVLDFASVRGAVECGVAVCGVAVCVVAGLDSVCAALSGFAS